MPQAESGEMVKRDSMSFVFTGSGAGRAIAPEDFIATSATVTPPGFSWLHVHKEGTATPNLLADAGLDHFMIAALTADETRPRCTVHGKGVLLNLRGINLNPDSEPEDMVSVRLWLEHTRIIGVWGRPLLAVQDLADTVTRGEAPRSPGDFVAKLALRLTDRAEPFVAILNEEIDTLEEAVIDPQAHVSRSSLGGLRRKAIVLRRYFVPQRDALTTLEIEDLGWLDAHDRARLREAAERVQRFGEELDAIRDRAQIVHDQIMDNRAEAMNRRMLLLSIVSAIFLPLGLLTGLLGINVGGMPGVDDPRAFWVVCLGLFVLAGALVLLFRKLGLFRT
jgi:zinc transporter